MKYTDADSEVRVLERIYPGHIRSDGSHQTNSAHCLQTAEYASEELASLGLSKTGYLLGVLHDCGKYTEVFRDYITRSANGEKVRRGSVDHSSAGLRFLLDSYHDGALGYPEIAAELLAYAIGAHHGLFDCIDENRKNGMLRRRQKDEEYKLAMERFFADCIPKERIEALFTTSVSELQPLLERISNLPPEDTEAEAAYDAIYFYIGLLERMLLSALIDADRRDTAEFMLQTKVKSESDRTELWRKCLSNVEEKLDALPNRSPIDHARRTISEQCAAYAEKEPGVYRLDIPTGGGKTLSSLRYALSHAAQWGKRRIIFTSPLLSILEQNAAEIRRYVQNDSAIVEHHSNVIREADADDLNILTERWSAPIIITTLVQLLDTIFSGRSACIRRFRALTDSVIVIDEVQSVPGKMLSLFNLAVNFLSELCGCTVILCSATQPPLEKAQRPLLHRPQCMVESDPELWRPFRRTVLADGGSMPFDDLAAFAEKQMTDVKSLLIICNRKDEAAELYRSFSAKNEVPVFYLSAAMCPQHRRDVLGQVKVILEQQEKIVCIATQVIEAGVDISFERVIRLTAGMDSIVQAAGRCNRHGENDEPATVWTVNCSDEKLDRLAEIGRGKQASLDLLYLFREDPVRFGNDLFSAEAIEEYYDRYFCSFNEKEQDDFVEKGADSFFILDLLAQNRRYADENSEKYDSYFLHQAFRLAGDSYHVFDDITTDVLVPYGEGRSIIKNLIALEQEFIQDYDQINREIQRAKSYTVSVYDYQLRELEQCGVINLFDGQILALCDGFYDETGIMTKMREAII